MTVWPEERLREDLAGAGGRARVSVSALFEAFQVRRPGERAGANVSELLEAKGVGVEPPLGSAGAGEEVTLYLLDGWLAAGDRRAPDPTSVPTHETYQGGVLAYCSRVCVPERVADAVEQTFDRLPDVLPAGDEGERAVLRVARSVAAQYAPTPEVSPRTRYEDRVRRLVGSGGERQRTCELVPTLLAAAANEELGAADLERLERHLGRCGRCRDRERTIEDAERAFQVMVGAAPRLQVRGRGAAVVAAPVPEVAPEPEPEAVPEPEPEPAESEPEAAPPPPPPALQPDPDLPPAPPPRRFERPKPSRPKPLRPPVGRGATATQVKPKPTKAKPVKAKPVKAKPVKVKPPTAKPVTATKARRAPMGRGRRWVAAVCAVLGVLVFAEGLLTILWKEPFSSLLAAKAQHRLSEDLDRLGRQPIALAQHDADVLTHIRSHRKRQKRRLALLARTLNVKVGAGDAIAKLDIDKIGAHFVVVQRTDDASLRKGPSHYGDTVLPGQRGTVGIAGHRTTYEAPFRHIDDLHGGDRIVVTMPYGRFTYRVDRQRIVPASFQDAFSGKGEGSGRAAEEQGGRGQWLVLSACHPLYSASQRILVFAKLEHAQPLGAGLVDEGSSAESSRELARERTRRHLRAFGKRDLKQGDKGDDVRAVQWLLGLPRTGFFGPQTVAAVQQFQREHGLPAVGRVGPQTKRALARRPRPPSLPPTPPAVAPAPPKSRTGTTPTTPTTPGATPTTPQPSG